MLTGLVGWSAVLAMAQGATVPDDVRLSVESLPVVAPLGAATDDWLISSGFEARAIRDAAGRELSLTNGLVTRTFRLSPNLATVGLVQHGDGRCDARQLLRAVRPEARVELDGTWHDVGGLAGQPNHAFLRPEWLDEMVADDEAFRLVGLEVGETAAPFAWKRVRHHEGRPWPPPGVSVRFDLSAPAQAPGVVVSVHYELYDGLPVECKWLTVTNGGDGVVELDRCTTDLLAAVEFESRVEHRGVAMETPSIHIETDFAFGGFNAMNANRHTVHWVEDPQYSTQVNYLRKTPCLLEVRPEHGPDQWIAAGATWTSFRRLALYHDSSERERQGLALRRMYRTIAPWVTENPLMMHVRHADDTSVRRAIEQCADVGFEMLILTFGSGFDLEDTKPETRARWRRLADEAHAKGVELGGYSLLSSRRIQPDTDNCIHPDTGVPGGQTHGFCPALASEWGQGYMQRLQSFFEETGFDLLEHDGSYPGDLDAAARPPLQRGVEDSRWVQWRILSDFYRWCRGRGVYLNVPDYYYLAGSNKCGMGYRETNWSLPRAQQVIHARQNMYDGTWTKSPSMGWMFVPLTEYHGGGAAATLEPLDENLATYEQHLANCLGMGVQACYRGPRLYDTQRTRDAVARWVAWFKEYRDILESDVVHGRRADGRDIDWMLHVNPYLTRRGMAVVYNPLEHDVTRTLRLPLYYSGLQGEAVIQVEGGEPTLVTLDRHDQAAVELTVPAQGMTWVLVTESGS